MDGVTIVIARWPVSQDFTRVIARWPASQDPRRSIIVCVREHKKGAAKETGRITEPVAKKMTETQRSNYSEAVWLSRIEIIPLTTKVRNHQSKKKKRNIKHVFCTNY